MVGHEDPVEDEQEIAAQTVGSARNEEPKTDRGAPPGPNGLPVIGSSVGVLREGFDFYKSLSTYGDLVSYRALGSRFVSVFDPELIETVLVTRQHEFKKDPLELEFGDAISPQGLAFTSGEKWKQQRSVVQSAFTPKQISSFGEAIIDETVSRVDSWEDGQVIPLHEECATITSNILARTLFDTELGGNHGTTIHEFSEAIAEYIDSLWYLLFLPDWVPTRPQRRLDRALAEVQSLIETLVAERRESGEFGDDLISQLVQAEYADGTQPDADEITDILVNFVIAGNDTGFLSLGAACWLLAGNRSVYEELSAELQDAVGGDDPTAADLPSLDLLEGVVQEALRMYPPVNVIQRRPRENLTLDGYEFDTGTTLRLEAYCIHRDERWWDAPDEFRPKRWLEETDRPEYAYFPFGGGPRHCIGMRFATVELQLALAAIVRRVDFERIDGNLESTSAMVYDPGPINVRVER